MKEHIKKMVGGIYYLPILAISWNNGLSLYIGFKEYGWIISTNKNIRPAKVFMPIKIKIKKIEILFDLSGFNVLPNLHIDKKSIASGFLFFSIHVQKA